MDHSFTVAEPAECPGQERGRHNFLWNNTTCRGFVCANQTEAHHHRHTEEISNLVATLSAAVLRSSAEWSGGSSECNKNRPFVVLIQMLMQMNCTLIKPNADLPHFTN